MRVKNTLFTAIAAGIVFLSGMVILGKNALIKKEQGKKDYTPINNTQKTADKLDMKLEDTVSVADTNLFNKVELEVPVHEKEQKTHSKDERLLLQMVNEMIQARNTNAVNFGMRKVVGIRGEERDVSNDNLHRQVTMQDKKTACKIREPSGNLNTQLVSRSGIEMDIGDKGG